MEEIVTDTRPTIMPPALLPQSLTIQIREIQSVPQANYPYPSSSPPAPDTSNYGNYNQKDTGVDIQAMMTAGLSSLQQTVTTLRT